MAKTKTNAPAPTSLTEEERVEVQKLIENSSLDTVAKKLQIAPQTLRTIAGGLRGQRGTLMLVRVGLAKMRSEGG